MRQVSSAARSTLTKNKLEHGSRVIPTAEYSFTIYLFIYLYIIAFALLTVEIYYILRVFQIDNFPSINGNRLIESVQSIKEH